MRICCSHMVNWKSMHIVSSRQWRQETAMSINICIVWDSLRSSLVIFFLLFYFSISWSKMTISIKINNGQPNLWCGIFLFSYFFFRILAILALENIVKILTTGPRLSLTCSKLFWHMFYDVVIFTLTQRELSGSSTYYIFLTWSEDADQTFLSNSMFFTLDQWHILI